MPGEMPAEFAPQRSTGASVLHKLHIALAAVVLSLALALAPSTYQELHQHHEPIDPSDVAEFLRSHTLPYLKSGLDAALPNANLTETLFPSAGGARLKKLTPRRARAAGAESPLPAPLPVPGWLRFSKAAALSLFAAAVVASVPSSEPLAAPLLLPVPFGFLALEGRAWLALSLVAFWLPIWLAACLYPHLAFHASALSLSLTAASLASGVRAAADPAGAACWVLAAASACLLADAYVEAVRCRTPTPPKSIAPAWQRVSVHRPVTDLALTQPPTTAPLQPPPHTCGTQVARLLLYPNASAWTHLAFSVLPETCTVLMALNVSPHHIVPSWYHHGPSLHLTCVYLNTYLTAPTPPTNHLPLPRQDTRAAPAVGGLRRPRAASAGFARRRTHPQPAPHRQAPPLFASPLVVGAEALAPQLPRRRPRGALVLCAGGHGGVDAPTGPERRDGEPIGPRPRLIFRLIESLVGDQPMDQPDQGVPRPTRRPAAPPAAVDRCALP